MKSFEILLYEGSSLIAMSAVVIMVVTFLDGSPASGARSFSSGFLMPLKAPAGLY